MTYTVDAISEPRIIEENKNFAVVYKPPEMHCAPLKKSDGESLTGWFGSQCPAIFSVKAKNPWEGGLMHRLDRDTRGLVLFAKNQCAYDFLQKEQGEGRFLKQYRALCCKAPVCNPGFPPYDTAGQIPDRIESFFRAYGRGRKEVRPVCNAELPSRETAADRGIEYRTEIQGFKEVPSNANETPLALFDLQLARGFRHQIRCHLAWIGYPILNDELYWHHKNGNLASELEIGRSNCGEKPLFMQQSAHGHLALCAYGLSFTGPDSKAYNIRIGSHELELSPDSG